MSNPEAHPEVITCVHGEEGHPDSVQRVEPREMDLGGELRVRRTLPSLERSFVGAWCFVDHYGPETGRCMDVPPHPHTGLQTLSWLFDGEIEHRDSGGVHALVRPGEVNLMTSGFGIAHSEVSTPARDRLHGVQLWVVLPASDRDLTRDFQHHAPEEADLGGVRGRVLVGSIAGVASPVATQTPLLGAELLLPAGATWETDVDPAFEHGLLVDSGHVDFDGVRLDRAVLGVRDAGSGHLRLHNPTDEPARVMLLGGEPFDEGIVMWWNFIARSHEEIVELARVWNTEGQDRFGRVQGYRGSVERLAAPPVPPVRLKRRFRRGKER
jgi:redox-sensitive bicupin YhaK (pirin superfamily)